MQEIHFAPGATSATVNGSVYRSEDAYVVHGKPGQFLTVRIAHASPEAGSTASRFSLAHDVIPNMQAGITGEGYVQMNEIGASLAEWAGDWPYCNTVTISVSSERDVADYALTVSITGDPI